MNAISPFWVAGAEALRRPSPALEFFRASTSTTRIKLIRRCGNLALLAWCSWTLGFHSYASFRNLVTDDRPLPTISARPSTWKAFPGRFESAFNDRFGCRDFLVRRHARLKLHWLGVSPTPRVWIGGDGWLFYNHEADHVYWKPTDPRLNARIDDWAVSMIAWRHRLALGGIKMLVVIVPDKQSVYPEFLPLAEQHRRNDSPLARFLAAVSADPDLRVLDLRGPLQRAKDEEQVYFRTDTHWTSAGAYVGYAETVHGMAEWFPGLAPLPPSAFHGHAERIRDPDMLKLIAAPIADRESVNTLRPVQPPRARQTGETPAVNAATVLTHVRPVVWEQDRRDMPRVVLIHDSFGDYPYRDLLAEHCARLVAVPNYSLDEELIQKERPDVVIVQFVERMLQGLTPGRGRPNVTK